MSVTIRLVVRKLRRDMGRTLLVACLLILPLSLGVAALSLIATSQLSIQTRTAALFGQAPGLIEHRTLSQSVGPKAALDAAGPQLSEFLGKPIELVPEVDGPVPVSASGREVDAYAYGLDNDPIHEGRFSIVNGRWPAGPGEVALSVRTAEIVQARTGGVVSLERDGRPVRVVGTVAIPTDTARRAVLMTPEMAADLVGGPAEPAATVDTARPVVVVWYLRSALETADVAKLKNSDVWKIKTGAEQVELLEGEAATAGVDEGTALIAAILALTMGELLLIIFAVYAVMVSSSRRDFALLAAVGASPRQRNRFVAGQGILTGVVSALVGTGLGLGLAILLIPVFESRSQQLWDGLKITPLPTAGLALLVVLTPAAAAWAASKTASSDVMQHLGGHEVLTPVRRRFRISYGILAGVGFGVGLVGAVSRLPPAVFLGALLLIIAAAFTVRDVLQIQHSRYASWPIVLRLAARFSTRNPVRSATIGTVIASLMVILGLLLTAYGGMSIRAQAAYVPNSPAGSTLLYATVPIRSDTAAAAQAVLGPDAPIVRLPPAVPPRPPTPPDGLPFDVWGSITISSPVDTCLNGSGPEPTRGRSPEGCATSTAYPMQSTVLHVSDRQGLELVLGRPLTTAEVTSFDRGEVLTTDGRIVTDGRVALVNPQVEQPRSQIVSDMPATVLQDVSPYSRMPNAFISEGGLQSVGGLPSPTESYWFIPARGNGISADQESKLRSIISADISSLNYALTVERGSDVVAVMRAMTLAGTVLLTLVAGGLAILCVALASREMRPAMTTLAAAGAAHRQRSRISALHAIHIVALGIGSGLVVLALSVPLVLISMQIPFSTWPLLGLLATGGLSLASAGAAGHLLGSRIGMLTRRDLS